MFSDDYLIFFNVLTIKQTGAAGTMEQYKEASSVDQTAGGTSSIERSRTIEEEMFTIRCK